MGIFDKKTTIVHFNDCQKCNGQGAIWVTLKLEDGTTKKIRDTCQKCSGTGNKGPR